MKKIIVVLFCFLSVIVRGQSGFIRNTSIPVSDSNGPVELAWAGGLNFPVFSEIDLNNDTKPDLFVFDRSNSRVLTFINNGAPGTHCWEYAPQYADQFPAMQGWAFLYDYNCDNKPDIFCVKASNNAITQYRNDSQSGNILFTLVDSTINYSFGGPQPGNVIGSGNLVAHFNDIDGDGDMDILGQQFNCVGGFAYYRNLAMEHTGACDTLDDFVLETNVWGDFALRSGLFQNVVVGSWNVSCFQVNHEDFNYQIARRDDTYANIFTLDLDGDGDKDALIGDSNAYNSLMVMNGGNASHATMVTQDTLYPSYDTSIRIHSFAAHAYIDADNDGLKDLLVSQSEYNNIDGIYFYKNTGTNPIPDFNHVENNYLQNEMIDVGESATPVFFDYDSDGLLDLVVGNKYVTTGDSSTTVLSLYRNNGTATSPSFEFVTNDYAGLLSQSLPGQIFPAFGDLDGDGDEDMVLGLDDGMLMYYANTAGPGAPAVFGSPVIPFMLIDVGQSSTPQLIDLNRDGKLDLVIGGKNGLVKYFENTGSTTTPFYSSVATNDTLGDIIVQTSGSPDGFSAPFVFDQNGDYRMLVSCMKGDIYLYGNIEGNLSGTFTVLDTVLTKTGGSRYGNNISVSGGDLNGDTLVDMLLGLYGGGPQIYYQDFTNSISNPIKTDVFSVYPNPASETLVIKSTLSLNNVKCTLFDMTGRIITSKFLHGNYAIMDVSEIAKGAYTLRITSGKEAFTRKVIISR